MRTSSRLGTVIALLMVTGLIASIAAQCGAPATPETIVEKVVETVIVKETVEVIVEGTPQVVEKEVVKEVIVTQEVEVVVTPEPEEQPEKVLVIARGEPTMGLDPAIAGTSVSLRGIELIHDPLVERNEENEAIPWIAESWETNEDGSVWTFVIRDGLKFSDGSPLTAEDVKFSFERMKDSELWVGRVGFIESMDIDGNTIVFTMSKPLPEFLDLPAQTVQYSIVSKAACENDGCDFVAPETPVSGPWYLAEYTPKDRMVLLKNPHYWLEGYPRFDRIEFTFNEDATAAVAAVESGTADLWGPLAAKDVARLRENPEVRVHYAPKTDNYTGFGFDKTQPPFNDKRVRQAVGYLLEPDQRTETCWFDVGSSLYGSPIYQADPWHTEIGQDPWRRPREERIEIAAALLEEAGWIDQDGDGVREASGIEGIDDGTPFEVTVPYEANWPQSECHTLLAQEWLKDGGISMQPDRYDPSSYWTDVIDGKFTMWHVGIGSSEIPWEKLRILFHSQGEYNQYAARVSDPDLDAMIDAMLNETEMEARTELMQQVVDYVVDQQYFVAGGSQDTVVVANADLINFYVLPNHSTRSLVTADIPGR